MHPARVPDLCPLNAPAPSGWRSHGVAPAWLRLPVLLRRTAAKRHPGSVM